jgi:hypothetical protein
MARFKEPSLTERQSAAAKAKKAALERFLARPGPDDPGVVARQAERVARATERAKAEQARELEKAQRKAREAEAAEQAAKAAAEAAAREQAERAAREAALEAERKAARDERYAARKKRKR